MIVDLWVCPFGDIEPTYRLLEGRKQCVRCHWPVQLVGEPTWPPAALPAPVAFQYQGREHALEID